MMMLVKIFSPHPVNEDRLRRISELLDKEVTTQKHNPNVIEIPEGNQSDLDELKAANIVFEAVVPIHTES